MELQPPPIRFKLSNPSQHHQLEYSAILSRDPAANDQSEFQPFISNPVTYKVHPSDGSVSLKTSSYIAPKAVKQPTSLYQYFTFNNNNKPDNLKTTSAQNKPQNENYSYFNLGTMVTTPLGPAYAPSNQAKVTQPYSQPNLGQIQYYKAFRPMTPQPNPPRTTYQQVPVTEIYQFEKQNINNQNQDNIQSDQPSETEEEHENNEQESKEDDSIKPEFPSPPPFFLKSHNKYENIENPFADPNFDFDKFISKLRDNQNNNNNENTKQVSTNLKFQSLSAQNESKEKTIHVKTSPNIDLRTPVAFSSPSNKKKVNTEAPQDEDYYYYDDSEEESAKQTKNHFQNANLIKTNNRDKSVPLTTKKIATQLHANNNKKIVASNSHISATNDTKSKQNYNDDKQQKTKPSNDDDEYYDYYDYDEDSTKQEVTTTKKLITKSNNNTSKINNNYNYKNSNTTANISFKIPQNHRDSEAEVIAQNKSQIPTQKRNKFPETSTKKESTVDATRFTGTTSRITTIKFPKHRLVTTTIRPNRDRYQTSRNTTKNR